jgi:prepilin-type N-terminal cleavage/methylation domain-containing protein
MIKKSSKGFTVLELLVVLGISAILIGLVLTSLNAARRHSNDERTVSNVQSIALGLRDYFGVCRQYPATLNSTETCTALSSQVPPKHLSDIIPLAVELHTNGTNPDGSPSNYHYASFVPTGNGQDTAACTNFHLWVTLASDGASYTNQKSNKSAPYLFAGQPLIDCVGTAVPGGLPASSQNVNIFDIFK